MAMKYTYEINMKYANKLIYIILLSNVIQFHTDQAKLY